MAEYQFENVIRSSNGWCTAHKSLRGAFLHCYSLSCLQCLRLMTVLLRWPEEHVQYRCSLKTEGNISHLTTCSIILFVLVITILFITELLLLLPFITNPVVSSPLFSKVDALITKVDLCITKHITVIPLWTRLAKFPCWFYTRTWTPPRLPPPAPCCPLVLLLCTSPCHMEAAHPR